jgi:hypothetical protein
MDSSQFLNNMFDTNELTIIEPKQNFFVDVNEQINE